MNSPLVTTILFHLGPVPISRTVATTWAITAVLAIGSVFATRKLSLVPSRLQNVLEFLVEVF
jgi:F-type H+-transporting ATPase subunit a